MIIFSDFAAGLSDPAYDSATGVFTPPSTGLYEISLSVQLQNTGPDAITTTFYVTSGGPANYLYLQSNELAANASSSAYTSVTFSTIVSLTAGAAGRYWSGGDSGQ